MSLLQDEGRQCKDEKNDSTDDVNCSHTKQHSNQHRHSASTSPLLPLANKVENTDCGQEHAQVWPPKVPLPVGGSVPHLIHGPLHPGSPQPKQHPDRYSCFCRAHSRDQQTDKYTHTVYRPCYMCNNRPHLTLWDVDIEDVLAQAMCLFASFSGK